MYDYFYSNSSLTLNYTLHCSETKDTAFLATLGTDNEATVGSACKSAETVWFMQWAGPSAIGIGNIIVAAVSWVFSQAAASLQYDESETETHKVKRALKNSTALVVLMLTIMYAAQYVSGANVTISSGLLALGAASVATIVGFMLLEFGFARLNAHAKKDAQLKTAHGAVFHPQNLPTCQSTEHDVSYCIQVHPPDISRLCT